MPSVKKIGRSAKSDSIRLFSRVFWSEYTVIFSYRYQISTGLPYQKSKKNRKKAKLTNENVRKPCTFSHDNSDNITVGLLTTILTQ